MEEFRERLVEQELIEKDDINHQLEEYMIRECLHRMINNSTLDQLKKIFIIKEYYDVNCIGVRVKSPII